jgi:hypothetical protein
MVENQLGKENMYKIDVYVQIAGTEKSQSVNIIIHELGIKQAIKLKFVA